MCGEISHTHLSTVDVAGTLQIRKEERNSWIYICLNDYYFPSYRSSTHISTEKAEGGGEVMILQSYQIRFA
jgi:hypothetical protein